MLGGTILREIAKYDGETAWWSRGGDFTGTNVNNPFTTGGYNFLAGLFGFEEKIPEIQGSKDSGYRKSVYVRWDLLCQIINQLCQDAIKDSRKTKSSKAQQYEEQVGRKLQVPIAELTYMGPNQKTVSNQNTSAGSSKIPPADWISENPEGKLTSTSAFQIAKVALQEINTLEGLEKYWKGQPETIRANPKVVELFKTKGAELKMAID